MDAMDLNPPPKFVTRKTLVGLIVSPPASNDRDLMAALRQAQRQVSQVLRRGDDVRVEGLVEKQNLQLRRAAG